MICDLQVLTEKCPNRKIRGDYKFFNWQGISRDAYKNAYVCTFRFTKQIFLRMFFNP